LRFANVADRLQAEAQNDFPAMIDRLELPGDLRDHLEHRLRRVRHSERNRAASIAIDAIPSGADIAERLIGAARQPHDRNLIALADGCENNRRNLPHGRRAHGGHTDVVHQQHDHAAVVGCQGTES
jgi:hypothetical protein